MKSESTIPQEKIKPKMYLRAVTLDYLLPLQSFSHSETFSCSVTNDELTLLVKFKQGDSTKEIKIRVFRSVCLCKLFTLLEFDLEGTKIASFSLFKPEKAIELLKGP